MRAPDTRVLTVSGRRVLVDAADLLLIAQFRWCICHPGRHYYYAHARAGKGWVSMHRLIAGVRPGQEVDHINHNGLDNRRANLRPCSKQENQWNRVRPAKGVRRRPSGRWQAYTMHDRRQVSFGTFTTKRRARDAYKAGIAALRTPSAAGAAR